MKKITSFTIDHEKLLRGIYVSRKDVVGIETITTFDIRMKEPNREPVLNVAPLHTIEHLGATYLRNSKFKDKVIYFGPMGCRTGFYLLLAGNYNSKDVLKLIKDMFLFISKYEGKIPGASPKECGNYLDQNLNIAKYEAKKYVEEILKKINDKNLNYPN